jgi:N-acetylglucosamine-6-phosphate deacetylase
VFASLPSAAIPETVQRTSDLHGFRDHPVQGGAELLGVHLEGPYLAAAQCGAHDPALLSTPAPQDIDHLTSLRPAMVTLAPELPGALAAVERFARVGTIVAAGHSEATGEDLRAAVARGLSHVTHLWSGQTQTTRQGPWRVPGLLEESLVADGLTAEVIADGRHLPPPLLEIARRCVGENLIVVSDATAGAGMPAGYQFSLSAVDCVVRDGVGMVVGQDSFGGSTTTLPGMLLHLHRDLGWPLAEVLALMTERPAGIAGVTGRKGRITAGADADLVVLDPDLNARLVTVGGEIVPGVDTAPT